MNRRWPATVKRLEMTAPARLQFLSPAWFTPVMGLAGLALAWFRAAPLLGVPAVWVAQGVGFVASALFVVLLTQSVRRVIQFPQAVVADLTHPVRHAFVAAIPVGLLLVTAFLGQVFGQPAWLSGLWLMAAFSQLLVTWWVLSKWLQPQPDEAGDGISMWSGITPLLFIPVVGNVVAPLAGIPLGYADWSVMQAGIGLFFWPLVLLLVLVRRAAHSSLPIPLLPTWCIAVAPPSVLGLVACDFQAPLWVGQMAWAMGFFCLLWSAPVLRRAWQGGFHMGFWALSFPLAALTGLSFVVGEGMVTATTSGTVFPLMMQGVAVVLLVLTTAVTLTLCVLTVSGLRAGRLLVADDLPTVQA